MAFIYQNLVLVFLNDHDLDLEINWLNQSKLMSLLICYIGFHQQEGGTELSNNYRPIIFKSLPIWNSDSNEYAQSTLFLFVDGRLNEASRLQFDTSHGDAEHVVTSAGWEIEWALLDQSAGNVKSSWSSNLCLHRSWISVLQRNMDMFRLP